MWNVAWSSCPVVEALRARRLRSVACGMCGHHTRDVLSKSRVYGPSLPHETRPPLPACEVRYPLGYDHAPVPVCTLSCQESLCYKRTKRRIQSRTLTIRLYNLLGDGSMWRIDSPRALDVPMTRLISRLLLHFPIFCSLVPSVAPCWKPTAFWPILCWQ